MAAAHTSTEAKRTPFDEQLLAACKAADVVRDCELELVLEPGTAETRDKVVSVARQFVPSWDGLEASAFEVAQLHGGVTNVLHLVSAPDRGQSPQAVLVRVFGANTEQIIDRERDNLSLRFLAQEGVGVHYYGRFRNGRVEGFLDGAKTLTPDDVRDEETAALIAKAVARMHGLSLPGLPHGVAGGSAVAAAAAPLQNLIWQRLDSWMEQAEKVRFLESQAGAAAQLARMMGGGGLARMRREVEWLRAHTAAGAAAGTRPSDPSSLVRTAGAADSAAEAAARVRAASFLHETVFCHNDLLGANLLLMGAGTEAAEVRLVDVEYSGPNPRAMDIANHFCEFAGLDFRLAERYPATLAAKTGFLLPYVAAAAPELAAWLGAARGPERAAFWEEAARQVDEFALASHAMWGVWSVVQARWSTVDFGFMEYARLRWEEGFLYHKRVLFPGAAAAGKPAARADDAS